MAAQVLFNTVWRGADVVKLLGEFEAVTSAGLPVTVKDELADVVAIGCRIVGA
jgi:hypothetical protein